MRIILNLCLIACLAIFSQSCSDDDAIEIDCEVKLAIRENSCSSFTFFNVDQLMMDWEVNGVFIERGQQFSFDANTAGTFTICGNFEKPGCPSDTLVCEIVEVGVDCNPENACQVDLISTQNSCSAFTFSNSLQVTMDWSVNGSPMTTAQVFEFEAQEAGSFEICGFFETPECPTGAQECMTLEIEDDCFADTQNEACEVTVNIEEISCASFSFSNNRQVVMDWRVNDEFITTAELFEFEAVEAGSFEICGLFETPDCPMGGEDCVTVMVEEGCFSNDACEIEVSVENTSCSSFLLGNNRQLVISWSVDGAFMTTSEVFEFEAQEAGSFEICGLFETPDCPMGGEDCVTVVVEEDCFSNDACEIELSVANTSCSSFFLGSDRPVVVSWSVDGILMAASEVFQFEAQEAGSFEICGLFETPDCPMGGEDCVTVEVEADCFSNDACDIEILIVENPSCSSFFLSNLSGVVMDWRVNGELMSTADFFSFEAQEAGSFEICGSYETPDCPQGGEDCLTIVVEEDCF